MPESGDNKGLAEVNISPEDDHVSPESTQEFTREKNHGRLFWLEMAWRFALAIVFSVLIVAILYSFSQKGNLSRWQKRWFNVLTILFSSLVSLTVGSLLGLLGSMLRWQLLARRLHKPIDVDLVLGMPNPTGSLKLIWQHTKGRRWSTTTTVVMIYLIVNIIGRLSVASFGLTYDLNELPGVEYPVKLTNWSDPTWFNSSEQPAERYRRISDYGSVGLPMVSTEFDPKNPATFTLTNASGEGLDRKVDGDKVTYSYPLKEYQGLTITPAKDRVLHSSSSCVGSTVWGKNIFTDGKLVGNTDEIDEDSSNMQNMLESIYWHYSSELDYFWASPLGTNDSAGPGCATTYIYTQDWGSYSEDYGRNATMFECTTCLSDTNNKPGLGTDIFFGQDPENANNIATLLLNFGAYERVAQAPPRFGAFAYRFYSSQNMNSHFLNDRESNLDNGATKDAPRVRVPDHAELYAAHLTARVPLLPIIGADSQGQLQKATREFGASERPFISVVLEVKWTRAAGVLVGMICGQIVAIAIVKRMCRNIFLRDHDSFLSVARLLRTVTGEVKGQSTETGKELAAALDKELVRKRGDSKLRYGTRNRGGEYYEADIWLDVNNEFPTGLYA